MAASAGGSEQYWISGGLLSLDFCGTVVKLKLTSVSQAVEMAPWVKVLGF